MTPRLFPCAHCSGEFLAKDPRQRFCTRRCAALARPPRPRHPRRRRPAHQAERLILRLLDIQPLERRARGGWRFGTKAIGEPIVERLIASGRARIEQDRLHLVARKAAP